MTILIAEDDENMRKILKLYLQREGYSVACAADGEEALAYFETKQADLLILDWMMPKMDGIEVCKALRLMKIPVKIIMLTAKTGSGSELQGLVTGADDYIKKPFNMDVLLIRIKKLCHVDSILTCGRLILNTGTYKVLKNQESLELTKTEYELLKYLMSNQNIVLTREQLLAHVWGIDYEGDSRTIDTHIRRLRKKAGDAYIKTCFGTGYMMEDPHE